MNIPEISGHSVVDTNQTSVFEVPHQSVAVANQMRIPEVSGQSVRDKNQISKVSARSMAGTQEVDTECVTDVMDLSCKHNLMNSASPENNAPTVLDDTDTNATSLPAASIGVGNTSTSAKTPLNDLSLSSNGRTRNFLFHFIF